MDIFTISDRFPTKSSILFQKACNALTEHDILEKGLLYSAIRKLNNSMY